MAYVTVAEEMSTAPKKYKIDPIKRIKRFLILGSDAGSYYATPHDLTMENAKCIVEAIDMDKGLDVVDLIRTVSVEGLAYRQTPTMFALAICTRCDKDDVRSKALTIVPDVCRTLAMLAEFLTFHQSAMANMVKSTGWGHGLRKAISTIVNSPSGKQLAYQATKYKQRNGWSFRDVLRKGHPIPRSIEHQQVLHYVTQGKLTGPSDTETYKFLEAVVEANQSAITEERAVELISTFRLAWEHFPSELLKSQSLWKALLTMNMPMTAMIRNLGRMTTNGTIRPMNDATEIIVNQLRDETALRHARIHPFQVLLAMTTYASGHGVNGKQSWDPVPDIVAALEDAFYMSFKNVTPTGARTLLALDVSGSMEWSMLNHTNMSAAEAAAAMMMVTLRTEKSRFPMAFSHSMIPMPLYTYDSLEDVKRMARKITMGPTNCAAPMQYALENNIEVDAFIIYTDCETNTGPSPMDALRTYREEMGIPNAKLVVVGMTSSGFSIADPTDFNTLDVVGFSADAPNVIADHIRQKDDGLLL